MDLIFTLLDTRNGNGIILTVVDKLSKLIRRITIKSPIEGIGTTQKIQRSDTS